MTGAGEAHEALEALTTSERSEVLDQLLSERPGLVAEAERLAATVLADADREVVADELIGVLLDIPFTAIGDRVGRRPGRGYVEEGEATAEVLEEHLEPFLDDLRRTAKAGFSAAATELGLGLLMGLYRLRDEAGPDTLIGWRESDQEAWELATSVVLAFDDAGLEPPRELIDTLVPDWAGIA